jgi:hypothetical protein
MRVVRETLHLEPNKVAELNPTCRTSHTQAYNIWEEFGISGIHFVLSSLIRSTPITMMQGLDIDSHRMAQR